MEERQRIALNMVNLLPGKASACVTCANLTGGLTCKFDNQAGFYIKTGGAAEKKKLATQLAQKVDKMPVGCPIKILYLASQSKL